MKTTWLSRQEAERNLKKKHLVSELNEFSKDTEQKINVHKSITFLYTNNTWTEIKNTIPFMPFIIAHKMNYFNVNLTKHVQDLYG